MSTMQTKRQPDGDDRFFTIPQASRELGIPAYKLRRAVKRGVVRSYGFLDGRRYVRISDIHAAMAGQTQIDGRQGSFAFRCSNAIEGNS